jgi:ATP-dependent Lhr-like helicase
MTECALDFRGAELARDYIAAAKASLGAVPSTKTIVAERFFDESGGMQLIIHAPFGGRINRAWGMALRKRFCRQFDFELQAAATDDGVLLSLSPHHSFPLEAIFEMLHPEIIGELLEQAYLQAPVFRTRWRWNLTRSLALLRFAKGRRVPAPLLRMRADDLLSAVFPEQQGCQDNHGLMATIEVPDHPLVRETVRDCLVEPADAAGLREVLRAMKGGSIEMVARETPEPSVLSHEILNANPYAFLDDAPLEERRARAVTLRRGLPAEIVERIGGLDANAIRGVIEEAQPDIRNADELHDLLLDLVALPEAEGLALGFGGHFEELVRTGRAARFDRGGLLGAAWATTERREMAEAIWPADNTNTKSPVREAAIVPLVRARLAIAGPVTSASLGLLLGLEEADVDIALGRVEADGGVLRGRFSPVLPQGVIEWCDRRLLARIHRRTVDALRRAIEPVSPSDLLRFLFAWQGVAEGASLHGRAGLLKAIDQLQGFELAAGAWESDVLPARVAKYDPVWLDALCLSGEVIWGRLAPRDATKAPPRSAPVTLARRRDLGWLLAARDSGDVREGAPVPAPSVDLSPPAASILASLTAGGASFFDDIVRMTGLPLAEVEDGIWELVAAGKVTGDGFAGLRALLVPPSKRVMSRRVHGDRYGFAAPLAVTGRWSLLRVPPMPPPVATSPGDPAPRDGALSSLEPLARQYLARYGVVLREVLAREASPPAWRDLLRVYRRLEARGEIRGGRFVAGLVGEQFALPEALEALRAIHRAPRRGEVVRLSACDPLNLAGILTPGPRVPAMTTGVVVYCDGIPLSDEEARAVVITKPAGRKAISSRARAEGRATA